MATSNNGKVLLRFSDCHEIMDTLRLQDPRLTLLDIPKLMRRFEDKGQDLHRGEQVAKKANSMK